MEVTVDISGVAIIVADTAGLHETADFVEQIGIQRARQRWISFAQAKQNRLIIDY